MPNILLQASGPNVAYSTRSTSFTSDGSGIISVPPYGTDLVDLLNQGCVPLPPAGIGRAPALVTGRFYGVPRGCTPASVLTVLGTLYAYPVLIPNACTLASLNMSSITGQTGGKMRCALFYDNGAGYPGAIVAGTDSLDLAATATAVATKGSLAVALEPGIYWVASIFTASSTMPSVAGTGVAYAHELNSLLGSDTAAHALATSAQATSGIAVTSQTYPATSMTVSFPTFPVGATPTLNAATPIVAIGV